MDVCRTLNACRSSRPTTLAIGFFDGVHRGHQAILRRVVSLAEETDTVPCVLTFALRERNPKQHTGRLIPEDESIALMAEYGIEKIFAPCFDEIADFSPEETVKDFLRRQLSVQTVVVGEDIRFGKDAVGDLACLRRLGPESGLRVESVPFVPEAGEKISSTRIRKALAEGNLESASRMLGRPFGFTGEVIHGAHLGYSLGFPTLNQAIPTGLFLPAFGVYASAVTVEGERYIGVTNLGVKPSVQGKTPLAETHLFGVERDVYGRTAKLELLHFIRAEQTFPDLESLKQQIQKDCRTARAYHQKENGKK